MTYARGAVVVVSLDPVIGSEQGRVRPCVIVSDLATVTASNARPLYVIVPLSTTRKLKGALAPRLQARSGGLPLDSTALMMHIRSIDPQRIIKNVGTLDPFELQVVMDGLRVLLGLKQEN